MDRPAAELTPAQRIQSTRRFAMFLAVAVGVAAALPALLIVLSSPSGSSYIGSVYNTDDHMVYAAWMRQAMDGSVLFDNRFTTDAQPGLTLNLYFLVLGLVAKVVGIPVATNLARVGFSALFVWLIYRLVRKLGWDVVAMKLAIVLPIIAGGLGFLVWHTFGTAIVTPSPLSGIMLSRLPIDVWQPEAFVFPSMLSNGLFMVSLCLIVGIFTCVVRAKDTRRAVLPGAAAMLVLMNIHSYDVLLVTFVLVGLLAASVARGHVTRTWVVRVVAIGLGAVPAALWFVYVLQNDPVFQARAATATFSPNFRQVLFGLFLPMALGLVGMMVRDRSSRRLAGVGLLVALYLSMFVGAAGHLTDGYFMAMPLWVAAFLVSLVAVVLLSDESPVFNLFLSWAVLGTVAIYFPAMFQRKLAMGLVIPWSVLAAYGIATMLKDQERSARNLVAALSIVVLGAGSVRWAGRELRLAAANVSNTSVHPVYLSANQKRIIEALNEVPGRKVVVALPGVPSNAFAQNKQEEVSTQDLAALVPDLNPIVSGLTGAYTVAGHWSETPEYATRRGAVGRLYFGADPPAERLAHLRQMGVQYVVTPNPESVPGSGIFDFASIGEVVVDGSQFRLVRLPDP